MDNNSNDVVVDLPQASPPNSASDFSSLPRNRFSFAGFNSMPEENGGSFSDFPPPPDYTLLPLTSTESLPHSSPSLITPRPSSSQTLPRASSPRTSSSRSLRHSRSSQRIRPIRCKSGNASVGIGDCTDVDHVKTWKMRYVDIRENVMCIAPAKESKENRVTISLKTKYVSMPRKKIVAIHGGPRTLLIRSTTEIDAHHWLMTLSQYCYVAPMMDGYCEKLCRGKNEFKERYLRLCSDGVLSWYRSDNEDAEPRGSIQVRGEESWIDNANPKIIHIQVEPKGYQFRFYSKREAELWQAALHWHYGRKLLRKASVPIRNKAAKQSKQTCINN